MPTFPPLGTRPCDHPATFCVATDDGYAVYCATCEDLIEEVRNPQ